MIGVRIGLVTPGFPPQIGGVESVTGALAEALVGRGHRVTVLAHTGPDRSGAPGALSNPSGLDVKRFRTFLAATPFPLSPSLWMHLRSGQKEWDVMNVHSFHASLALASSFVADRPMVFTPHYHGAGHTVGATLVHHIYDPVAARIFDRAAVIICVSEAEGRLVAQDYPRSEGKIQVVHNGVDVSDILAARPFEGEPPTLLHVGRLERYKQVEPMLRAMVFLDDQVRMVVVGVGSDARRLRAIAGDLGISARVHFAGRVPNDDVWRWQRTAQVAVCLSAHEAFGLTVVEAAVAGARVIASDIPAHREVADRVAGRVDFVRVDVEPDELADVVKSALSAGRPHPMTEASELGWDASAGQTEACLMKALE